MYKEEADDPVINALVSSLKNTIDANQNKRAGGFSKENTEMTEAILKYKNEHPEATQREISNAVGCSVGKVNKALANSNFNTNDNSNLNNNSVNLNMNDVQNYTPKSAYAEKAAVAEGDFICEKRRLEELQEEELDSLLKDLRIGRGGGMTYSVLYKKYNLYDGSLSKDTINDIKRIKDDLETQEYFRKQREAADRTMKHFVDLFSNEYDEEGEDTDED